jgi:hypothetical protein
VTLHINRYLHQQSFVTEFSNCTRQLVAPADCVKTDGFSLPRYFPISSGNTFDLATCNSVMTARSLRRTNLTFVDPLFQGRELTPAN